MSSNNQNLDLKYKVNIKINKFGFDEVNLKNLNELIKSIEDILAAYYSSAISIKLYFLNQINLLKNIKRNIEEDILERIKSIPKKITNIEICQLTRDLIKKKLEIWLSIRYQIDNTVMYFHKGENLDEDMINNLFQPEKTSIKQRPMLSELNQEHLQFKDNSWNLCSYYGIKVYFKLINQGLQI